MDYFHKIILININFKIKDIDNLILKLSAIFYLYGDLQFILATDYEYVAKLKEKFITFNNVKIILKDNKALTLKTDKECNRYNHFNNTLIDGREITSGNYWINEQYINTSECVKYIENNNQLIVYYIGESNLAFYYKNYFHNILNKLINDLSELRNLDNLIYVYKPIFTYTNNKVNLSNQRIDDAIQVIRNFNHNYFHQQCPILYGANVNSKNVLSFCISNNLDGFVYEWEQEKHEDLLEFIKKIHGWQRIIINQARRKKL